jgi:hypothetical protein
MVGTGDIENEGDAISKGNLSAVHPLVHGLPVELPQLGRNDAGVWRCCCSFQYQLLGDKVLADAGESIQKEQVGSRRQLVYRRDLHQGQWSVEVPVPYAIKERCHHRFPAACQARYSGSVPIYQKGDAPKRRASEGHDGQEWRQQSGHE